MPLYTTLGAVVWNAALEIGSDHPAEIQRYVGSRPQDGHSELLRIAGLSAAGQRPSGFFPFETAISTMLGIRAPSFLLQPSLDGYGKIQLHETSRLEWRRLASVRDQVLLEDELQFLGGLGQGRAREVVVALWAMVALTTLAPNDIFTVEGQPRITSVEGSITMTTGHGVYVKPSIVAGLARLSEVLCSYGAMGELEAVDVFWLAASIADVTSHVVEERGTGDSTGPDLDLDLFISHRGPESKRRLMNVILDAQLERDVFLDCLSLPKEKANRYFVFRNLVRSRGILLVQTPKFSESAWCRKEREAAQVLADCGLLTVAACHDLDDASAAISRVRPAPRPAPRAVSDGDRSWVTSRILKDLHGWGTPKDMGHRGAALSVHFDRVLGWIRGNARRQPSDVAEVDFLVDLVRGLARDVHDDLERSPDSNVSWGCWSMLLNVTMACLTLRCSYYSKLPTREVLDAANFLASALPSTVRDSDEPGLRVLLLLAAVGMSLKLLHEDSADPFVHMMMSKLVEPHAFVRDGVLLVDVRVDDRRRPVLLRLVKQLVLDANIGTVGILQSGLDPVHDRSIDGRDLSVLPCVTYYSGMDRLLS